MKRFVNWISGGGSTNLSILKQECAGGILNGITRTVAIVSSSAAAGGIKAAEKFGFAKLDIYAVDPDDKYFSQRLLEILDYYQADYFHQLGWEPFTPEEILNRYQGFNQHLGPGGRWMVYERRIYAHIRFCQEMGEKLPIPVFCQFVHPEYDKGDVIYMKMIDIDHGDDPKNIAKELLPIEHEVQIEGRRRTGLGLIRRQPVPKIARNTEEEELLFAIRKEARDKYPPT